MVKVIDVSTSNYYFLFLRTSDSSVLSNCGGTTLPKSIISLKRMLSHLFLKNSSVVLLYVKEKSYPEGKCIGLSE